MAKDKSAETPEMLPADPADAARAKELQSQRAVVNAVFDRTHDKDGNPIPIVEPEAES